MEDNKQIENNSARRRGRPRGSPNKSTAEVREAVARLVSMNIEDADEWLSMVAYGDDDLGVKADPAKALDLLAKISEFHLPKLARTEHSGPDNGPIKHLHGWLD